MALEACSNKIIISIRLVKMDFNLPYRYTVTINVDYDILCYFKCVNIQSDSTRPSCFA